MRVLWLTNTPSGYILNKSGYNGGGWLSSLEFEIAKRTDIELGVCFIMKKQPNIVKRNNIVYFPIDENRNSLFQYLYKLFYTEESEEYLLKKITAIIEQFKPDLINVFGTERCFGLLAKCVSIPIVIHLQGFLNPCKNAFLVPGQSFLQYIFSNWNFKNIVLKYLSYDTLFAKGARREREILKYCKYYMGRTEWDYNLIRLFATDDVLYFNCNEILRPLFYDSQPRETLPNKLTICTTISDAPYKGFDVILKCAKLLKDYLHLDFVWKVFGNVDPKPFENRLDINVSDYNILVMGVAQAEDLVKHISGCTCFVHPSYIDNSPNSVCEAQILGCPVIAQYVGGVPSIIEQGTTGILVPANDPYQMAIQIKKLYFDRNYNIKLGRKSREIALKRHDKNEITNNLVSIYMKILQEHKN